MKTESSRPGKPAAAAVAADPEAAARRTRRLLIGVVLLAIGVFVFFLLQALQQESEQQRWDKLDALIQKYEPAQDPIWQNPYGVYNPERLEYIGALQLFLEKYASESDDALEPHTRYLIAKTVADHILSNPGIIDPAERGVFYDKAVEQLEAIRDEHPDFPLNWSMLSSEGFPSLTRQFLKWFSENRDWEKEHMLRPREPAEGVRVLLRTDRGDLLLGLYSEHAPAWTKTFVDRVRRGHYDGTFFVSKREIGDVAEPEEHSVRAAGAASHGLKIFDTESMRKLSETRTRCGLLPEESRNRIPHQRGIVSVWHDPSVQYDHDEQFIIVDRPSPMLDYVFTPFAKLLDESGINSLATLGVIFGGDTWREDKDARSDSELRGILDHFQAPVKIVKALVYENDVIQEPGADALPTRVELADDERQLSGLRVDRYKVEPPVKPVKKPEPKKGDDEKKADEKDTKDAKDEPKKKAGGDGSGGDDDK